MNTIINLTNNEAVSLTAIIKKASYGVYSLDITDFPERIQQIVGPADNHNVRPAESFDNPEWVMVAIEPEFVELTEEYDEIWYPGNPVFVKFPVGYRAKKNTILPPAQGTVLYKNEEDYVVR